MTLVWRPGFQFDVDASTYIEAVEAADEAASPGIGALETNTRYAINNFVIGCKQDGIWSAIKASCILAGARTLDGALVPLVGTAPTNYNFVAGDYNRETGLVGDGSTKYLDSNRNNNADPQDNHHLAFYASSGSTLSYKNYIGSNPGTTVSGSSFISTSSVSSRNPLGNNRFSGSSSSGAFFSAIDRNNGGGFFHRSFGVTVGISMGSAAPQDANISVFTAGASAAGGVAARLAFYSIGESLDLALLDSRVTDLVNAIGAAIP